MIPFPDKKYLTILADPPWPQKTIGKFASRNQRALQLPYQTMTIEEIKSLPVEKLADIECHLWLWTTNRFLHQAFHVMDAWGFKYMQTITWVKPSGCGAYFANTTQHLLFGYYKKCFFRKDRFRPTSLRTGRPKGHSVKPIEFYDYIEGISREPRIELFARKQRDGWDVWGNEVNIPQRPRLI